MEFVLWRVCPYIIVLLFLGGTIWNLWRLMRSPVPLEIRLTPAPSSKVGLALKWVYEIFIFPALFRNDKTFWSAVWVFHVAGLALILSHLLGIAFRGRFFCLFGYTYEQGLQFSFIGGAILGISLIIFVTYFFYRRLLRTEVRMQTNPSDYFALVLILAVILSGDYMRFFTEIELGEVMDYLGSLAAFQLVYPPPNLAFKVHFILGEILFVYFPFSKLFHPFGAIINRLTMSARGIMATKAADGSAPLRK